MPELPEVETIKQQLSHYLPFKILKVETSPFVQSILHTPLPKSLNGSDIISISRHGKLMRFSFNRPFELLSHLGMSGSWIISEKRLEEKHQHIIFLTSQGYLTYVDPRRFGHAYFYKDDEVKKYMQRLGADIAGSEFTKQYLKNILDKFPEKIIKPFLLDQKYFAGSGNYIANEVCAHAKIHPERTCKTLSNKEISHLHRAFSKVLDATIKTGGVAFSGGYKDAHGDKGKGLQHLVVFHQTICKMCNQENIQKIQLQGRGTFFCPKCQKR